MKCGACNGDGRAYSCGAPVRCSACNGRGTVADAPRWLGDPASDPDTNPALRYSQAPQRSNPPDLAPDYPGLTDEDGAMVAFMVRCKRDEHGGPYLPAYLAGWFLAACRAPLPFEYGQFRDSIRNGHADCVERQARRVQYQARPVECERAATVAYLKSTGDRLVANHGLGAEAGKACLRAAAASINQGAHRDEPE